MVNESTYYQCLYIYINFGLIYFSECLSLFVATVWNTFLTTNDIWSCYWTNRASMELNRESKITTLSPKFTDMFSEGGGEVIFWLGYTKWQYPNIHTNYSNSNESLYIIIGILHSCYSFINLGYNTTFKHPWSLRKLD